MAILQSVIISGMLIFLTMFMILKFKLSIKISCNQTRAEEISGSAGYINHLDCGNDFTGPYM